MLKAKAKECKSTTEYLERSSRNQIAGSRPLNTLNTLIIVHKTLKILKKASQTSAVMLMRPSAKGHAE